MKQMEDSIKAKIAGIACDGDVADEHLNLLTSKALPMAFQDVAFSFEDILALLVMKNNNTNEVSEPPEGPPSGSGPPEPPKRKEAPKENRPPETPRYDDIKAWLKKIGVTANIDEIADSLGGGEGEEGVIGFLKVDNMIDDFRRLSYNDLYNFLKRYNGIDDTSAKKIADNIKGKQTQAENKPTPPPPQAQAPKNPERRRRQYSFTEEANENLRYRNTVDNSFL